MTFRPHRSVLAGSLGPILVTAAASAGVGTFETVAAVGDATPAGTLRSFASGGWANDAGQVVFGGTVGPADDPARAFLRRTPGGNLEVPVVAGRVLPGGGTVDSLDFGYSLNAAIDAGGRLAGDATVRYAGGESGTAVVADDGSGDLRVLAATDPDAPPGSRVAGFGVAPDGYGVFGSKVGETAQDALRAFDLDRPGVTTTIVIEDDPLPGGGTFRSLFGPAVLGVGGDAAFQTPVRIDGRTRVHLLAHDRDPDTLRRVMAPGDAAPGGGTFGFPLAFVTSFTVGPAGGVAFAADLDDGRAGVWAEHDDQLRAIARAGDPLARGGTVGDLDGFVIGTTLDAAGRVAFHGGDGDRREAIYRGDGLSPASALARTGEAVAAAPGFAFDSFYNLAGNAAGQLAFAASLEGVADGERRAAGFFFDGRLGLVPIRPPGDDGPFAIPAGQFGPTRSSINAAGQVVTFLAVDGVSRLSLWTPPTLDGLLPGDADFDGRVDLADFTLLAGNFGLADAYWSNADFTGDRRVDLADFTVLADHFGDATAGEIALMNAWRATVPEPAAAGGLLLAGALATRRRGRGRMAVSRPPPTARRWPGGRRRPWAGTS